MNWKNVKTVLIITLAAVNLLFAAAIAAAYNSINAFDNSVAENMKAVLERDGIILGDGAMPSDRVSAYVFECVAGDDYYDEVAAQTGKSPVARRYSTPDGADITLESGAKYSFSGLTRLSYTAPGHGDVVMPAADAFDALNSSVEGFSRSKYSRIAESFIGAFEYGDGASTYKYKTETVSAYFDEASGLYFVLYRRALNGLSIAPHEFVCAVSEEEVVALNGELGFSAPGERYVSQLIDQINILFNVKEYIGTLRSGGDAVPDALTIESMTLCYCTYFTNDEADGGDRLVYVPGWEIHFKEISPYIFNAIDGTIYTNAG